jgi:hypothetical protein
MVFLGQSIQMLDSALTLCNAVQHSVLKIGGISVEMYMHDKSLIYSIIH